MTKQEVELLIKIILNGECQENNDNIIDMCEFIYARGDRALRICLLEIINQESRGWILNE